MAGRAQFLVRAGRHLKPVHAVLNAAVRRWIDDLDPSMGVAIAFYTAFSLGPTLPLMIDTAGLVSDSTRVEQTIHEEFTSLIGPEGAAVVTSPLFAFGKFLITLYIGSTGVVSVLARPAHLSSY